MFYSSNYHCITVFRIIFPRGLNKTGSWQFIITQFLRRFEHSLNLDSTRSPLHTFAFPHFTVFASCDLSPVWISEVWLRLTVSSASSRFYHPALMPPPFSLPHLFPIFLFLSPCLPFLLVMRSIISQSFYTQEAAAWLLADVDKGWCCGCQAIQIISGIKRSIASFSKSSPFPDHRSSRVYFSLAEQKLEETKKKSEGGKFKLRSAPEVIHKKERKETGKPNVSFSVCWRCQATTHSCRHKGVFLFSVTDNVRMLYVIILLGLSK